MESLSGNGNAIVGEQEYFGIEELRKIVNARLVHPMSDMFAESKI